MRQLVRRYIGRRLFEYYSQPADRVVGRASSVEKTRLSSLLGEWHWRRLLQRYYEEREGHWLTPVELFQPHFSRILGDFSCHTVEMARKSGSTPTIGGDTSWEIIELGGGRGTNAKLLLSYLQEYKPEMYQQLKYTLVDSSPSLHRLQQEVLMNTEHANHVEFRLVDLMDVADSSTSLLDPSDTPTVVLAMEVLDNLPHDKVRRGSRKQLQQAEIYRHKNGTEEESFMPLDDPLLSKILQTVPSYVNPKYPTWIPSVACGIMEHVIRQRPNLGLAFADFDWLPAPDLIEYGNSSRRTIWGHGEPIITDMDGVDYECYLQSPPHCDILFPTDFDKLGSFAKRSLESMKRVGHVQVEKQADFLQKYGSVHVDQTKSWLTGHTPLLHDFVNCSVLTITTTTTTDTNNQ